MFMPLVTSKGENIFLNVEKVLFFAETKKGCSVILEDGTMIELSEPYDEILTQFVSCD